MSYKASLSSSMHSSAFSTSWWKDKNRVVRLHHGIRNLGRRNDRESLHNAIGVLLAHLRNQESAHSSPGAAAKGVAELKTLETVAALRLLPHHVKHGVNELGTLGVVALGPIVPCSSLAKYKIVRAEE